MREIKFRVWYKHEWTCARKQTMETFSFYELLDCGGADDIDDFHWMQYAGLKDKNGVEIYEGDVVLLEEWYPLLDDGEPLSDERIVDFKDGCFIVKDKSGAIDPSYCNIDMVEMSLCSVIGNIYENPELLSNND